MVVPRFWSAVVAIGFPRFQFSQSISELRLGISWREDRNANGQRREQHGATATIRNLREDSAGVFELRAMKISELNAHVIFEQKSTPQE